MNPESPSTVAFKMLPPVAALRSTVTTQPVDRPSMGGCSVLAASQPPCRMAALVVPSDALSARGIAAAATAEVASINRFA